LKNAASATSGGYLYDPKVDKAGSDWFFECHQKRHQLVTRYHWQGAVGHLA
jgi:hypothetical protein